MPRYHIQFEKDDCGDDMWSIWPNQESFPILNEPNQPYDPEENKMVMMTIDANSMVEAISIAEPKIKEFLRIQLMEALREQEEE